MAPFGIYLETRDDGRSMAHVLVLPGCFIKGPNPEATLELVPRAVSDYLAWAKGHGGDFPVPCGNAGEAGSGQVELELAEATRTDAGMESGDKVAIFGPDLIAPTDTEIALYLRMMEYSRADLVEVAGSCSSLALDRQPSGNRRTIRKILRHVAHAEEWYASRLHLDLPVEQTDDVFQELAEVRQAAVERLAVIPFSERARVFSRDEYISSWGAGERWTLRKTLRRFLEHEREHTESIRSILAEFADGLKQEERTEAD